MATDAKKASKASKADKASKSSTASKASKASEAGKVSKAGSRGAQASVAVAALEIFAALHPDGLNEALAGPGPVAAEVDSRPVPETIACPRIAAMCERIPSKLDLDL